jgi:uncharacterized membrane protein
MKIINTLAFCFLASGIRLLLKILRSIQSIYIIRENQLSLDSLQHLKSHHHEINFEE